MTHNIHFSKCPHIKRSSYARGILQLIVFLWKWKPAAQKSNPRAFPALQSSLHTAVTSGVDKEGDGPRNKIQGGHAKSSEILLTFFEKVVFVAVLVEPYWNKKLVLIKSLEKFPKCS